MTFNRHQPDPGLAAVREHCFVSHERDLCPKCAAILVFEVQQCSGYLIEVCTEHGCGHRRVIVPRLATEQPESTRKKGQKHPLGPQCGSRFKYDVGGCRCVRCVCGHNAREREKARKLAERAGT